MYPTRYQLQELTAHVVAALERRREGFGEWKDETEASLTLEAKAALQEAGRQFAEIADDKPYWQQLEATILTAALPRYFQIAKEQQAHEKNRYGLWRGGDVISRAAYAAAGLVTAVLIFRTAIPDWIEPLPIAMFIGGPLLPDLQIWFAKRKYHARLKALVDDMREEAQAREQYRPLMEEDTSVPAAQTKVKEGD